MGSAQAKGDFWWPWTGLFLKNVSCIYQVALWYLSPSSNLKPLTELGTSWTERARAVFFRFLAIFFTIFSNFHLCSLSSMFQAKLIARYEISVWKLGIYESRAEKKKSK